MIPHWERSPGPPPLDGKPLFFDAELRPYRSWSMKAFKVMLVAVITLNAIMSIIFIARGAYPVAGFLGLDVLALWFAFRWNYRAGQVAEYVQVAPGAVHVAAVNNEGVTTHWVLNPIWAKVTRDGRGVLIRAGDGQMRIGAFLSPKECDSFAAALDAALHKAKRGT
ncbi:MAG TPA: DUF2244 domain-containing protein [Vitreimonas sp.]|uniref:DUF2244 domain-containing protein n=1 Tax=Vitreimonas sp. TaxID=3069702 RepID=UPI002D4A9003|nr:DUF2244 domain-containing protein [Vitreimonas sp.]HYD89594.1 DUF2244 domain-containing protein [Vitreimonas sp.]